MAFRFRLARVLEWYERQYKTEESLLKKVLEQERMLRANLESRRERRTQREAEFASLTELMASDLQAREFWRYQEMKEETTLIASCETAAGAVAEQREVVRAARQRVRLIEKMRDRKREEFDYQAAKQIEETASDTWLAGFARDLNHDSHPE